MAGAYCNYCGHRCFVYRVVPDGPRMGWAGHMATCTGGMAHDLKSLRHTHETAVNPVTDPEKAKAVAETFKKASGERGRKALAVASEAGEMAWFAGQVDAILGPSQAPGVDRMTDADWAVVGRWMRDYPGTYPTVQRYWDRAGEG